MVVVVDSLVALSLCFCGLVVIDFGLKVKVKKSPSCMMSLNFAGQKSIVTVIN